MLPRFWRYKVTEQAEDPLGDILRRCHEDELLRSLWTNLHLDPVVIRSIVARLYELAQLADQYHNNETELIKKFDTPVEKLRQTHVWLISGFPAHLYGTHYLLIFATNNPHIILKNWPERNGKGEHRNSLLRGNGACLYTRFLVPTTKFFLTIFEFNYTSIPAPTYSSLQISRHREFFLPKKDGIRTYSKEEYVF